MRKTSRVLGVLLLTITVARAQELSVARAAGNIDTTIPWMTDGFVAGDPGHPVPQLPKTAIDRNKLLDEAIQKAAAEKKLVFWYIPRIEGVQMYRPALLDDYMRATVFTDPTLSHLIAARFVPLRMAVSKTISERTGIKSAAATIQDDPASGSTWIEPAIAILDKDGKIVHRLDRIRTFNLDFFRSTLLAVLEKNSADAPVPEAVVAMCSTPDTQPSEAFKASRAAVWAGYDAGADKIAEVLIKSGATDQLKAHGHFLSAFLKRLRRDAPGATAALDAAEKLAGEDAEIQGMIATERGILALRQGNVTGAQSALADAAAMKENPRKAEATYLLAVTWTLSPGAERSALRAEQFFRKVVAEFPDSPWAAQAAANVLVSRDTTPIGAAMHAFEDPFWPPPEVFSELRTNTAWGRPAAQPEDSIKRAVSFLLAHQSDNGGFLDSRYAYWDTPRILPNTWMAITAIALAGLSDWREVDPEAIDKAIKRGEKFLFTKGNLAPGQHEEVYADLFRLLYLKRRLARMPADSKDAAPARARLNEVAKALVEQQSQTGFFMHEYPNPFATGAALMSLKQAQELGAAVPAGVFELGAKGLRKVRSEKGAFAYGEGRAPGDSDDSMKDSMARSPLCERAIMLGTEQQDTAALEAALDNFDKWLPRFERIRTCDFHTDGQLGGFFFWHGMYFTSEAIKALPPEKRAAHNKKLVDQVMNIGELDGSFLDSHEMGKSYGTGMALMVLKNALEQKP